MLRIVKRLLIALLVLCALLAAGYVYRAPLLQRLATAWIVNEPLTKSDVIVVLGGGLENRPFEAARLFHLGLAPKILLMNPWPSPATQLGLTPTEADLARNILLNKEVPAEAIFVTSDIVTNSFDESIALANAPDMFAARAMQNGHFTGGRNGAGESALRKRARSRLRIPVLSGRVEL